MEKATRGLETCAAAVVTISSRGPISAGLRSALDDAHPERLTPKDFSVTSIREQLTHHLVAQRRRAIEVALQLVSQVDDSLGRVTKGAEVRISHAAQRMTGATLTQDSTPAPDHESGPLPSGTFTLVGDSEDACPPPRGMRWGAARFHSGGGGVRIIAHLVTVRPARFVSTPSPYSGTQPAFAHRASQSSTGPASSVQSTSLRVGGCDIRERYSLPGRRGSGPSPPNWVRAAELVEAEGGEPKA